MAVSQERITVYNLADLKNTSDDAIPNYLNSLKFKQSHFLTDVRLGLGYGAFLIAAACFLWDYKFGFQSTKYFTATAVTLYTILNSGLTLWVWQAERGTVYVGTAPSGETVRISTSTKKNVPRYNVTVEVTPKAKSSSAKPETFAINRPFAEWFDSAGHFVVPPFQSMLATGIPCVGRLDPKRVVAQSSSYTPELLDALSGTSTTVAGSTGKTLVAETSSSDAKKGGKKRRS